MKHPQLKNESPGSNAAVLINVFVHVAPPSVEVPWKVSIRCGSVLVSCQIAEDTPSSSTPTAGKNWLPAAGTPGSPTLTHVAGDQVAPKSFEVCAEMFVPDVSRSIAFCATYTRRERVASYANPIVPGIRTPPRPCR